MRIAVFHNHYQQPGGEDVLFADETALLESKGHTVIRYSTHNHRIDGMGRFALAAGTVWNGSLYQEAKKLFRDYLPDVAYFYNTFPLISPSVYYAARSLGVPVVQQLQNYRLLCPGALFFRDNRVCEECLGKRLPWPALRHGCYRNSRAATAVVAAMLIAHRILGTWWKAVDIYIAPTVFARRKFIEGGLPEERIVVKSNFIHLDIEPGEGLGGYALFVGRLSGEKGIKTLLSAWQNVKNKVPLKIVGDGPLAGVVQKEAVSCPGIEYLGYRRVSEIFDLVGDAKVLIFPSEWYEGLPRTIIEAFARGTPVIASRLGAMESLVEHGRTGLHFTPGDAADLAAKIEWFFAHPEAAARMRLEARAEYQARYTGEGNYKLLKNIFDIAMKRAGGRH